MRKKVLIIGWYGTETAGDKAILASIVSKKILEGYVVEVASMYPYVTEYTLYELGLEEVKVVSLYDPCIVFSLFRYNEVIMGGGPLMHIKEIHIVNKYFNLAKRMRVKTVIYGCGIGPFKDSPREIEALKQIVNVADEILVRDTYAKEWIENNTAKTVSAVIDDPAVDYVRQVGRQIKGTTKSRKATFFLRSWPRDYSGYDELNHQKKLSKFNNEIILTIEKLEKAGYDVKMIPMHCWCVGDDDRDYYLRLLNEYYTDRKEKLLEIDRLYSASEIINEINESEFCLSMRFHSVLFSEVLGAKYCAIDYTNKGKIYSFLHERNRLENYVALENYSALCIEKLIT